MGSRRRLCRLGAGRPAVARRILCPTGRRQRTDSTGAGRLPARCQAPASFRQGKALHLSLHERRAKPGRHVRPQAGVGEIRRHAVQRATEGRLQRAGGRVSHALAVRVPTPRRERPADQQPLSAHGEPRRRFVRAAGHVHRHGGPRLGLPADEHRQRAHRQTESRRLAQLRTRRDQRESAQFRRDDRSARRTDRRRVELVLRFHARLLSGHPFPQRRLPPARPGDAPRNQRPIAARVDRPDQPPQSPPLVRSSGRIGTGGPHSVV